MALSEKEWALRAPRNRGPMKLAVCEIEIEWLGGMAKLDPNEAGAHSVCGDYPFGLPLPHRKSMLSGKPAYLYRQDDVEFALTFDELDRFMRHDLKPKEYDAILAHVGMCYPLHDDFYQEGGYAWQPRDKGGELKTTKARIKALSEQAAMERSIAVPKKTGKAPGL